MSNSKRRLIAGSADEGCAGAFVCFILSALIVVFFIGPTVYTSGSNDLRSSYLNSQRRAWELYLESRQQEKNRLLQEKKDHAERLGLQEAK